MDDDLCDRFEVDLQHMGVDLGDWFRHKVSLRKLTVYARLLPPDSFTVRELARRNNPDEEEPWSESMQMLVHCANVLQNIAFYQAIKVADPKGPKPTAPQPIRPPGWRPEKKVMSNIVDVARLIGNVQSG